MSDLKLVLDRGLIPGFYDVKVDAAPIADERTDAGAGDGGARDAGIRAAGSRTAAARGAGARDAGGRDGGDSTKLPARCIGVVSVLVAPLVAPDGTVTEWKISSATVEEVKTPGHEWKKPSGGGGGWD